MKKIIAIGLLCVSNMFAAEPLKYPLDIMADNPDLILFVNGHRVYRLVNPEPENLPEHIGQNHYLAMTTPEHTWNGINVNDIPRFTAIHVKHAKPDMQHTILKRLLNTVPDSHGGFIKLNCLLEITRQNPRLTKVIFRWTLENAKQFGIIVGNEVMAANPEEYMAYRAIVDDVAPEMANTFELGYVWLTPRLVGPGAPLLDRFATE